VDEYAKLRDQIKNLQRDNERLKRKLATGAGDAGASDLQEIGGVQVWTPRFELDKKAHAAVVDEFRNKHRDQPFVVLSSSVEGEGVHVIAAVSDSLKGRISAPDLMKRLGLRGGGRPDFAQGGGVAPADVDALREKGVALAQEVLKSS